MSPLPDPWQRFRALTRARIGLGQSGDAVTTPDLLAFQLAHAHARDAVHGMVAFDALETDLATDHRVLRVRAQVPDRAAYLRRPDWGRVLDSVSRDLLRREASPKGCDVAFIIADGLSAAAVNSHAVPVLRAAAAMLTGWSVAPIVLAQQARVALGDEIGAALGAEFSVILIGERPGLSVADSLGIYLTRHPQPGRTDAERNCISNIHQDGLSYSQAAAKLHWLLVEGRRLGLTGVGLKEDACSGNGVIGRD